MTLSLSLSLFAFSTFSYVKPSDPFQLYKKIIINNRCVNASIKYLLVTLYTRSLSKSTSAPGKVYVVVLFHTTSGLFFLLVTSCYWIWEACSLIVPAVIILIMQYWWIHYSHNYFYIVIRCNVTDVVTSPITKEVDKHELFSLRYLPILSLVFYIKDQPL